MSLKNSNDNIANRTREISACDPFTRPPCFRLYTAFWGRGSERYLETFRNIFFWKLGEIRVKKKFYIFVQKRKCLFFFKF